MDIKEQISLGALVISLLSLLVALLAFVMNYRKSYGERLKVEILEFKEQAEDYVHVYKVEFSKEFAPRIEQIAKWVKIRISNLSSKPTTIVGAFYQEDQNDIEPLPFPFVKEVNYKSNEIRLSSPVSFPLKLETQEAIEVYILVPISIKRELGEKMLPMMVHPSYQIASKNKVKEYLGKFENDLHKELTEKNSVRWLRFEKPNISNIAYPRDLIKVEENSIQFLDSPEQSKDGYIFMTSSSLHALLFDLAGKNNDFSFSYQNPAFDEYKIIISTSNRNYRTYLNFTEFDRVNVNYRENPYRRRVKQLSRTFIKKISSKI